ncbi:PAS domain-containing sensor histidine kinase [Thiosulfatimonas sediminis]|uniref:Sensory histidine kinase/phosphatase NtrB n=1 Tax=Thiosulfatimonas sediminis TaxID=2675054 RepID=A0A6F8PUP5_9GAMM|nr:nitrogen regulation protein NR(II) [Thiosulfatimonas sediminis]BBP45728.1 PAS domain-containing sensor histidine kinase [Thiosulfatimonas sediminis]
MSKQTIQMIQTESDDFFREVLEGLTTAVLWVDRSQTITFMNVAAGEIFQLSPSRVIGTRWHKLMPNLIESLELADEKKITVHEYVVEQSDLFKVRVSCTISPYELGVERGWLFELYNTERHHRIVEEDERWHQYEAGNLLIRTLAHEVKNPLAGILGAAQLLQRRFEPSDKANDFLDIISKEVLRLKNLVDRMLGPKQSNEKEEHNIHELIRYVLQITEGEKPNNVYVKLDYDPSIPEVMIDFEAMVQALLNLVKNAIQAMQQYGGMLTIRTRVEHKFTLGTQTYPLVALISISDEGEGIAPEVFDSIFYPMVSTKKEGTGLGLPVAQNVLRQHDGLIVAESEPGKTTFNVYLPLKQKER